VHAQKSCVIASAEDHVPIREALIHTDNNHWARTDYRGYFEMKYAFDSATVSKQGYVKTTIYLKELPDTVFLLPESRQLGTVEVWGKNQEHIVHIENQAEQAAKEAVRYRPKTSILEFDVVDWFNQRDNRDYRHLKKARKILQEADRKQKDPIVDAYEQVTGKSYTVKPPESEAVEEEK
jgi:hypothetical protein